MANDPRWDARFNEAYNDCLDPDKGSLTKKPVSWHPMEWEAYCNGVQTFEDDNRR